MERGGKASCSLASLSKGWWGMKNWKQREEEFDEVFAFASKLTHQVALLILIVVGLLGSVVSTTAMSVIGVQELLRRLGH